MVSFYIPFTKIKLFITEVAPVSARVVIHRISIAYTRYKFCNVANPGVCGLNRFYDHYHSCYIHIDIRCTRWDLNKINGGAQPLYYQSDQCISLRGGKIWFWFGFGSYKMDLVWIDEPKSFPNHILINVVMVLV